MVNEITASREQPLYVKVSNFPGLYRNTRSGRYYGSKKLRGKRKDVSLRTTDRKIAERRLDEWVRNLDVVDRELEKTTVRGLIQKLLVVSQGKPAKIRVGQAEAASLTRRDANWKRRSHRVFTLLSDERTLSMPSKRHTAKCVNSSHAPRCAFE